MSVKTSSTIAGLTTFVLVILLSAFAGFMQMVMLNGATSSQGFNAMAVLAVCQVLVLLAGVVLARRLTQWLMIKFNWSAVPAIIVAVTGAVLFSVGVSFLSIIVGALASGVR